MTRAAFFIDGFNLYHSIESNPQYHKYKWLNLHQLSHVFLTKKEKLTNVYYFTALTLWKPNKTKRHKTYIRALEQYNVETIYGKFKKRDKTCPKCKKKFTTAEEKQTDVNIAIHLFQKAIEDQYDTAYIISGDSDLIPSVKAVRKTFPDKRIGIIIPIGREANELKNICDFYIRLKEKHLTSCLLPQEIDLGNNTLFCPPSWK